METNKAIENKSKKCPYLDSEEDYHRTTIYPICTCKRKYCDEYEGHCSVRD